jgi:hypothetical protein
MLWKEVVMVEVGFGSSVEWQVPEAGGCGGQPDGSGEDWGGIGAAQKAFNLSKKGVSGKKLVVKVD